ncbi:protein CHROMATIN REMODELING 5-like [Lycium ferocissimum]|uniref:protein CHROMATIN REMODELING 5-like n=1 Tax=Lycium ferocissimum TaxID=112874 RepID=UPI0028161605|nr:protein CHROMATIN REMODELING 5-like [Lycium ferocissimum]
MTVLLWNYVSTFSILSGGKLRQIYSKLKQVQHVEGKVGPSQFNGSAFGNPTTGFIPRGFDAAKFEAWKRRKRAEADVHSQVQPLHQRTLTNGACLPESNLSSGILGAAPLDNQQSGNGRAYRTHQSGQIDLLPDINYHGGTPACKPFSQVFEFQLMYLHFAALWKLERYTFSL